MTIHPVEERVGHSWLLEQLSVDALRAGEVRMSGQGGRRDIHVRNVGERRSDGPHERRECSGDLRQGGTASAQGSADKLIEQRTVVVFPSGMRTTTVRTDGIHGKKPSCSERRKYAGIEMSGLKRGSKTK